MAAYSYSALSLDQEPELFKVHLPEHDLVEGLKAGKKEAIERLYKMYSSSLLGIISRVIKFDEIAEDVLQETFLKVWKSIGQYDVSKGRLFTWMAKLAKNTAIDQLRSRGQLNSARNENFEDLSYELDLKHQSSYNPETIGIKRLLKELTPGQKQIIDLIYFEGYTHMEAAEELNIPIGTVKTRIRLSMLTLRKFF
ncbi:MAG: sigma-70 family RNA polymerase sigma factor [Pedobacter sp.]|nr:MAG: sigma-70 family RNA polymerase sigma factor [Pedobacter sp.]